MNGKDDITTRPRRALYERGGCAVLKGHAHHEQADCIVCGVAQEVEGVSLQRRGTRCEPCSNLHQEHDGVDREHGPKHKPITAISVALVRLLVEVQGGGQQQSAIPLNTR